jgi:AcrR family transcriptional regulator
MRRRYRSTVRAESARRTREAVIDAATTLFTARGYDATSLAAIADAAGVARPTVIAAFGSKPALLARVLDVALAGDDDPVPVAERPWFSPVWQATTAHDVLTAYSGACVLIAARAADVVEAVRRACDSSPDVAGLWATAGHNRRLGAAMVVDRVTSVGRLRAGLDVRRATDILWTLNDSALYASLVGQCHWDADDYQRWLAATMHGTLLEPASERAGVR